jgi:hypothetical protein
MSAALLDIDVIARQFERKLLERIAALPHFLDDVALSGTYERWPVRTLRDARQILQSHAAVIAQREAEILSSVTVALGLLPRSALDDDELQPRGIQDDQIPLIIGTWPWSTGGQERPEHLELPRLLADALVTAGADDRSLPADVDADELAGWLRAHCPHGVVSYSTPTSNGATVGELIGDCHRLSTTLVLPAGSVSTQQLTWLYVNVEPADARAGLQPLRQAAHIISVLGSVSKGNAQRRLLDVIVPAALAKEGAAERRQDERVRDDLASAVRRHISKFMEHLAKYELPKTGYCEASRRAIDGDIEDVAAWEAHVIASLWADARSAAARFAATFDEAFSSYVEQLGKTGRKLAHVLREKASERESKSVWKLWLYRPEGELYLVCLAQVLWCEEVQPETKHRETHRPPGIVRAAMLDRMLLPMTQQLSLPANDDELRSAGEVRDERGRVIGSVALTTDATLAAVRSGCQAFGTVHGHLLIRALIHRAADWWTGREGVQDARPRIRFRGGWNGLLDELGIARKFHQRVKDIAVAGQCIAWSTPTIAGGGLWTWTEDRGTRAGAGEVAFVLGDALSPGYASELARSGGNSHPARVARRLVPELRFAPPLGGARSNDHGPIWTLHRLLVIELVDRAEALHVDGAAEISLARWHELAESARLPKRILDRTLDAWLQGESESAPALLERRGRDRWTLADPHRVEREYIAAGGAKRVSGRRHAQGRVSRRR